MQKLIILLLVSISYLSQGIAQYANDTAPDKLIEKLINDTEIVGIAAGYTIDGEQVWKSAKGHSDLKNKVAFSPQTVTRIASLAKPMTAVAIMQLVEQNLIDLDAPIQKYIPDFPKQSETPITTRNLLAHTSGIAGYKNTKEALNKKQYNSLEDALTIFKNRDLKFEPGSAYQYTSYGYVVLGRIIEKASGLSYEQYMQKNIWNKANMPNTSIEKLGQLLPKKSKVYHKKGKKVKLAKANNLTNRIPGGGFQTTLDDMLNFGNAILNNSLITEESLQKMIAISFPIDEGNPYGFGWVLYGPKGQESGGFGHGGGQIGANTQIFIKPASKSVSVVLSNTSGTGNQPTLLALDLLHHCDKLMEK